MRLPLPPVRVLLLLAVYLSACKKSERQEHSVKLEAPAAPAAVAGATPSAPVPQEPNYQPPVASLASLPPPRLPPFSSGVALTLNLGPGRAPLAFGETNLPDGTRLVLSFYEGPCPQDQAILGEGMRDAHAEVSKGRWSAQIDPTRPLRDGTWEASIMVMDDLQQPPSVQAILGENGKNMKGPLAKRKESPIPTVEAARRVSYGEPKVAAAATRARCPKVD